MKILEVQLEGDFLDTISRVTPVDAVSELIWNSLDADASAVSVSLERNRLGGIEAVVVRDNGHGIGYEDAVSAFAKLGGSWKRKSRSRIRKRQLHGQQGRGRYRSFAIGEQVSWETCFDPQSPQTFAILGRRSETTMTLTDPTLAPGQATGTTVVIKALPKNPASLEVGSALKAMTPRFALYLLKYRGITITYDGHLLDPTSIIERRAELPLSPVDIGESEPVDAVLTVIEWKTATDRALTLCDEHGFALDMEVSPGIQAAGFTFTAYLRAQALRRFQDENVLLLGELHPPLKRLVEAARSELRRHFAERKEERRAAVVEQWKAAGVYPFKGEPADAIEEARRQVFDVVALNVEENAPEIAAQPAAGKRFAFRLLKETLNTQPSALQSILKDVLGLGVEKQEELARLIGRVSLEGVIKLTKLVTDRLGFLAGLKALVFDEPHRSGLQERTQLQRLLAANAWVFLENYHLSVDDKGLTKVLAAHRALLGEAALPGEPPVRTKDGEKAIVDFMLSRMIPQSNATERHHLIVEIKRPTVSISIDALKQVTKYAEAISNDERFRDTHTRWDFWLVSNELDDYVRDQAQQLGRERGVVSQREGSPFKIWAKTWGQLIVEAEARHRHLAEALKLSEAGADELEYVRREHEKYLPKSAKTEAATRSAESTSGN